LEKAAVHEAALFRPCCYVALLETQLQAKASTSSHSGIQSHGLQFIYRFFYIYNIINSPVQFPAITDSGKCDSSLVGQLQEQGGGLGQTLYLDISVGRPKPHG
jgi:hypothetical protein